MHTSDNLNNEQYRGDVAAGIDWGTYPSARSYIIGVNLSFEILKSNYSFMKKFIFYSVLIISCFFPNRMQKISDY
jgi:hypothetical protein